MNDWHLIFYVLFYLLGVVHGKYGTATNLIIKLVQYYKNRPKKPSTPDRNYCPDCNAFLPSDPHKPMCELEGPHS